MDREEKKTIPYFVHEGIVTRLERINTRLVILCFCLSGLLLATLIIRIN